MRNNWNQKILQSQGGPSKLAEDIEDSQEFLDFFLEEIRKRQKLLGAKKPLPKAVQQDT